MGPPSPVSIFLGVISVSLHSIKIGVLTEMGPKGKLKPYLLQSKKEDKKIYVPYFIDPKMYIFPLISHL